MSQQPPVMDSTDPTLDDSSGTQGGAVSVPPEGVAQARGTDMRDASDPEGQEPPASAPQGAEATLHSTPGVDMRSAEIVAAVDVLAQVALQFDDPVSALDEGMEALAEVLADRDEAIRRQHHAAAAAQIQQEMHRAEFSGAYRHARLHRVGELVDLGYQLDQAVAITNANETDIRHRALAAGRDPAEVIYSYALLHGYQPRRVPGQDTSVEGRQMDASIQARVGSSLDRRSQDLEALAAMGDEEFSRATRGDRWQRLLQGNRG